MNRVERVGVIMFLWLIAIFTLPPPPSNPLLVIAIASIVFGGGFLLFVYAIGREKKQ